MFITGRQTVSKREDAQKMAGLLGLYLLKKKRYRDQDHPQVAIERYLKRLLSMLLCFLATEELRKPLRGAQPPALTHPLHLRNRQGEQKISGEIHDGSHQLSG